MLAYRLSHLPLPSPLVASLPSTARPAGRRGRAAVSAPSICSRTVRRFNQRRTQPSFIATHSLHTPLLCLTPLHQPPVVLLAAPTPRPPIRCRCVTLAPRFASPLCPPCSFLPPSRNHSRTNKSARVIHTIFRRHDAQAHDYCTQPAASLETQDKSKYAFNLCTCSSSDEIDHRETFVRCSSSLKLLRA